MTYTFNNIEAGKNLEVKVSAINIVGESLQSNSLLLIPASPPSSPRNPIITALSLGQISIEWEAALRENGASIDGYYVEYKTLSDASYSRSSLIDGLSTTISTLLANQPYLLRVIAHNNEGDSLPTESVFGYASNLPSSLLIPTVLSRKIDGITIGWS